MRSHALVRQAIKDIEEMPEVQINQSALINQGKLSGA